MPDDLARIRRVLMRELETINEYEQLAREAETPEARTFFLHLALEEKEHVAEATFLVQKLDADQSKHFAKDFSAEHFAPLAAPPLAELRLPANVAHVPHALPAPPSAFGGPLTVGPLKRRGAGGGST